MCRNPCRTKPYRSAILGSFSLPVLLLSCLASTTGLAAESFSSQRHDFVVDTISDELRKPWGMAFLPDGGILVTEKAGQLRYLTGNGELGAAITGLPAIREKGQGGLLGICLHPDFEKNRLIYLSYAGKGPGGYSTEVLRGRFTGTALEDSRIIFVAEEKSGGGRHFGSRMLFSADGYLFISLGDRGAKDFAQELGDHRGSLIRLTDDGGIPADNPFVGQAGARPEIFNFGHRNIQGMTLHPQSGEIWTHEHGPQGGDEINIEKPGVNYGWPVITYGVNYGTGTAIGEGTHREGMQQPVYKWVPSIAPSGMTFYSGRAFPAWRGNLFVGSLKFGLLVRLEMDGNRVAAEERLLDDQFGRIRDVVEGPDGFLYLLTDERRGKLLRLRPL